MATMLQPEHLKNHTPDISPSMKECIENCLNCHRACSELIPHCLEMGGEHASPRHISLLSTCSMICETSAQFMMMHSEFHDRTCGICAELCLQCANDCEAMGSEDEQMLNCARVCRRCAESCQAMATHTH